MDVAVLSAVVYASIFDYPLTIRELRLAVTQPMASDAALRRVLDRSLFLRSRLTIVEDWVLPVGRTDLLATRHRREHASRAFLRDHHTTLAVMSSLPFVRLVAISGSLAHLNAEPDQADLDLFVVAAEGHVWTVTVCMIVIARLLRRRHVVCANFVLSDTALALDDTDFFTASQINSLRPVTAGDVFSRFVAANPAVRRWFPNGGLSDQHYPVGPAVGRPLWRRVCETVLWLPGAAIEWCCRAGYGWHLRRHVASWPSPDQVRLERHMLKLHTRSHRQAVMTRYAALMDAALGVTATHRRDDACRDSS